MATSFSPNDLSKAIAITYTRQCAITGCKKEADLVAINTTYLGLKAQLYICQKHLAGK